MTTTKTPRPGFTSQTIVAILDAAGYGGDYKAVIKRSGVNVAPGTLAHWVQRGRREREAGEKTSLSAFYDLWEVAYPGRGGGGMSEARRLSEGRQAAKVIQARAKKTTTEDMPGLEPGYDIPRSLICECGAAKGRSEKLCRKCLVETGQL